MSKSKPLPPLERLFEVFGYDESGRLFWKKKPHSNSRVTLCEPISSVDVAGYGRVKLDRQSYKIHRIIWAMANGCDPGELEIDHQNRNKLDNRPQNLRIATQKQNLQNRIFTSKGATGELCIFPSPARCKNKPYTVDVCGQYLGMYATLEQARTTRDEYLALIRTEFSPASLVKL